MDEGALHEQPAELLRRLVRFDTTNPPGNEAACVGFLDVVTTDGQDWTHPPFEAALDDGFVWGRGTLDMKGGATMMAAALLRARARGMDPPGDVIFAAMADEEAGSD